jgi:hypothetical protein
VSEQNDSEYKETSDRHYWEGMHKGRYYESEWNQAENERTKPLTDAKELVSIDGDLLLRDIPTGKTILLAEDYDNGFCDVKVQDVLGDTHFIYVVDYFEAGSSTYLCDIETGERIFIPENKFVGYQFGEYIWMAHEENTLYKVTDVIKFYSGDMKDALRPIARWDFDQYDDIDIMPFNFTHNKRYVHVSFNEDVFSHKPTYIGVFDTETTEMVAYFSLPEVESAWIEIIPVNDTLVYLYYNYQDNTRKLFYTIRYEP